jgi:hypothetical protein
MEICSVLLDGDALSFCDLEYWRTLRSDRDEIAILQWLHDDYQKHVVAAARVGPLR